MEKLEMGIIDKIIGEKENNGPFYEYRGFSSAYSMDPQNNKTKQKDKAKITYWSQKTTSQFGEIKYEINMRFNPNEKHTYLKGWMRGKSIDSNCSQQVATIGIVNNFSKIIFQEEFNGLHLSIRKDLEEIADKCEKALKIPLTYVSLYKED